MSDKALMFQKLTPKVNMENLDAYKEAIDFAINDKDIKNVAITGIYGSGKTSIIETYKNNSGNRNFMHISLANFQNTDFNLGINKKENDKSIKTDEKTLEGKILNQLLHQIQPQKIPQTIFRVKRDTSMWLTIGISIIFILNILLGLFLWKFEEWTFFVKNNFSSPQEVQGLVEIIFKFSVSQWARLIAASLITIALTTVVAYLINRQFNRKLLKTLSFKGKNIQTDIEVFKDSDDSFFDKYLDDVIYLFNNAGADVFVFEDIDRFDNNVIFAKLKEINTLVNNRRKSKNNKADKITFIYLLKDDMFVSKERTKFFDFIIPVIPIMNASNSYDLLKKMLDNDQSFEKFNKHFLQNLSLYIDDLRLLKNIYNESIIYNRKLKDSGIFDLNKLLAIVTYKNVFPNDFANLQLNKGFVYQLFANRLEYVREESKKIEMTIDSLKQQIKDIEDENLVSIDELYALFFITNKGDYYDYSIDGKNEEQFNNRTSFIKALRSNPDNVRAFRKSYGSQYGLYELPFLVEEIHKIEENIDFIKRKENILNKDNINEFHQLINQLEEKNDRLIGTKLSRIIERDHLEKLQGNHFIKESDNFKSIKSSDYFDLLVFLLKSGYIDEGYQDYLTYFYPHSINLSDKKYLRSITDERKLDWSYPLNDKKEIFSRLEPESFLKIESLNFDLLKFLLNEPASNKRSKSLNNIFHLLNKTNNTNFLLKSFLSYDPNIQSKLLIEWNKYSPDLFTILLENPVYSISHKNKLFLKVSEEFNKIQILELNNNNQLDKFISNSPNFLSNISHLNSNLEENLIVLNIKFVAIPFYEIHEKVLDYIYINHLYKINEHNIHGILETLHGFENEQDIKHKNYSLILNLNDTPINTYVNDNVQNYIDAYLNFCQHETKDEHNAVYSLLNNDSLDLIKRMEYISTITHNDIELFKVSNVDLKTTLIEHNKVNPIESNILDFFNIKDKSWTNELVKFVNLNASELIFKKINIDELYGKDFKTKFFSETIKKFSLNDLVYEKILVTLKLSYQRGFKISDVPDSKMKILIENEVILFSEENLIDLRNTYSQHIIHFISHNLESYFEIIGAESNYSYKELVKILDAHQDNIPIAKTIIDNIKEPISFKTKHYKTTILNYVLDNKFSQSDLDYICENYNTFYLSTKNIIYNVVVENIQSIIDNQVKLDSELLKKLIFELDIELDSRQIIFSRNITIIKKSNLKEYFKELNLNTYIKLINEDRRGIVFEKNEINTNILNFLKNALLISRFKDNNGSYRANSNRKTNQI